MHMYELQWVIVRLKICSPSVCRVAADDKLVILYFHGILSFYLFNSKYSNCSNLNAHNVLVAVVLFFVLCV